MNNLFGIIGNPLDHSFSPSFFEEKFSRLGLQDYTYEKFPLHHIYEFPDLIIQHPNLKGLNVTLPYKRQIIPFLHQLHGHALKLLSVNVVKISKPNELFFFEGFNTDASAFDRTLSLFLNDKIFSALILGTGATSDMVAYVLDSYQIKYNKVSRNPIDNDTFSYEELSENIVQNTDLIINTTPVGTFPNTEEMPDFPVNFLDSHHLIYDVIYNPAETKLLYYASLKGCRTKNGLEMLYLQADMSWEIWNK